MAHTLNLFNDIDRGDKEPIQQTVLAITRIAMQGCSNPKPEHKQWYLEQILEAFGWDIDAISSNHEDWPPGVKPLKPPTD